VRTWCCSSSVRSVLFLLLTAHRFIQTERAIQHQDFSGGQFRFTRIRVVFPIGFDVCDSVIAVQGNMSGVTIRKYGSDETKPMRFYKAGSTVSTNRATSEPSLILQGTLRPPPRTGFLRVPSLHYTCIFLKAVLKLGHAAAKRMQDTLPYRSQQYFSLFVNIIFPLFVWTYLNGARHVAPRRRVPSSILFD